MDNVLKKLISDARKAAIAADAKEDKIYSYINEAYPNILLDSVETGAENADNLDEAITCYVRYGEYTVNGLVEEFQKAKEAQNAKID